MSYRAGTRQSCGGLTGETYRGTLYTQYKVTSLLQFCMHGAIENSLELTITSHWTCHCIAYAVLCSVSILTHQLHVAAAAGGLRVSVHL